MNIPSETKEWSDSELDYFNFSARKAVVVVHTEETNATATADLHTEDDWDNWLTSTPNIGVTVESAKPGLYVVLCSQHPPIFGISAPLSYIPFTRNTWNKLVRHFHVPLDVKRAIAREAACFSPLRRYASDSTTDGPEISYTARMAHSATLPNDLALSSTYVPTIGSTFAVVYGCTEEQLEGISRKIKFSGDQIQHPLMMPGLFAELERKRLSDIVESHLDEFILQSNHLTTSSKYLKSSGMNDKQTQTYLGLCLQNQELVGHIRAVKRQLSKLLLEFDDIDQELRTFQSLDMKKRHDLTKVGLQMKRRVQDILREYDDKIESCNMIINNTSLAMQTVWNHIAREDSATNTRIAKANAAIALSAKMDSAQMKSIAILTMVYLPISSVAALFSMNMFNWEADSLGFVVSKHIWLFAVLAAVLTCLTLLAWHLGTRREKRLAEKSNLAFQDEQDDKSSLV